MFYWLKPVFPIITALALMVVAMTANEATADGGSYVGISIGQEYIDADYTKGVGVEVAPASYMQASDQADDNIHAFTLMFGHRWMMSERFYLAGEVDATVYADNRVSGFLQGTGLHDRDVWPGTWTFEKRRGFGVNAKFGYMPASYENVSLYMLGGIKWLDATIEGSYDNEALLVSGSSSGDVDENPWLFGIGMEFGNDKNRFDLRLQYTDYDVDFGLGSGATVTDPVLRHEIESEELGIYFGYITFFEVFGTSK